MAISWSKTAVNEQTCRLAAAKSFDQISVACSTLLTAMKSRVFGRNHKCGCLQIASSQHSDTGVFVWATFHNPIQSEDIIGW